MTNTFIEGALNLTSDHDPVIPDFVSEVVQCSVPGPIPQNHQFVILPSDRSTWRKMQNLVWHRALSGESVAQPFTAI